MNNYQNENDYVRSIINLINENSDINMVNKRGQTKLFEACALVSNNAYNIRYVKLLLDAGINPNIKDKMGNTAIMGRYRICCDGIEMFNVPITIETVKLLLEYGADPYVINKYGNTLLINACQQSDCELIKFLLNHLTYS